jgi:hypothetical protein
MLAHDYPSPPPGFEDVCGLITQARDLAESALESLKKADGSLDDITRALRLLNDAGDEFRYAAEAAEAAAKGVSAWDLPEDRIDSWRL